MLSRAYPQHTFQVEFILEGSEAEPLVTARLVVREVDIQNLSELAEIVTELDLSQ